MKSHAPKSGPEVNVRTCSVCHKPMSREVGKNWRHAIVFDLDDYNEWCEEFNR